VLPDVFAADGVEALVDLHRTASGLPNEARIAIQRHLRDYVTAVLRDEWRAMARHDEAELDRVGLQLDQVWTAIHRCRPETVCETTMYSEVLSRFNDVTDLRTGRLTSAGFRIPLTMKILLYLGALILTGSMYLVYIPALWLHGLVTASLTGAVAHESVPAYLSALDVAVVPYAADENFYFSPLKLVEYLAAGRPVVAADIGDIGHCVRPGETGWLYEPGDGSALAAAIRSVLADPVNAAAVAAAGRAHVCSEHAWEQAALAVVELAGSAQGVRA